MACLEDKTLLFELDAKIYSKEAILKCLYWHIPNFSIDIKLNKNIFIITLVPKEKISAKVLKYHNSKIEQDLYDYNLRQVVISETKNIRDLITAKALSNGDIISFDPPGDVEDPVGINIEKIK